MITIRPAVEKDVTRITEIYNEAILTTVATFDTEEKSLEDRETSLYVDRDFRKQGVGKQLLEVLVLEGAQLGLHSLIARITHGNEQSVYLHERLGFTVIGTLREVGVKFGAYHDVHMLQKVY